MAVNESKYGNQYVNQSGMRPNVTHVSKSLARVIFHHIGKHAINSLGSRRRVEMHISLERLRA